MFKKLKERNWTKKAEAYLKAYPEHEPMVKAMFMARVVLQRDYGPRECAELLMGRELTNPEWDEVKQKWQPAFLHIFG